MSEILNSFEFIDGLRNFNNVKNVILSKIM